LELSRGERRGSSYETSWKLIERYAERGANVPMRSVLLHTTTDQSRDKAHCNGAFTKAYEGEEVKRDQEEGEREGETRSRRDDRVDYEGKKEEKGREDNKRGGREENGQGDKREKEKGEGEERTGT
jgi:hypothetical protein